jgi:hypothetical protein
MRQSYLMYVFIAMSVYQLVKHFNTLDFGIACIGFLSVLGASGLLWWSMYKKV